MKVQCLQCKKYRTVRAHESRFCYESRRPNCSQCGHANRLKTLGQHGPGWKGGRHIDKRGYVRIRVGTKYRFEHRVVWEATQGTIPTGYVIHHRDGNKQNNSISNLVCLTKKEHDVLHREHLLANHWNRATNTTENLLCVA